jgi:hypothetical protein
MRRLRAAVLALYPRRVRQRYGEEIRALLEHSPIPVRDLADVARCALGERLEDLASRALPEAVRRIPRPMVTSTVTVFACVAVGLGFATVPAATPVAGIVAGLAYARRDGRYRPAGVVIGVLLLLFTSIHLAQLLAGQLERVAEATATALFIAGAAGLSALTVALVRHGRRLTAWAAAVVGGLALAHLASTALVLIVPGRLAGNPWLAYWVMMLPYRGWNTGSERAFVLQVDDVLVYYPVLYTFAISFLLAFCIRTTTSAARTRQPRPAEGV